MPSLFDLYPDLSRRSVLTPGGDPAADAAYLAWRRGWEAEANARWLDRHTRFGDDLPGREPIEGYLFDEFAFIRTGGNRLYDDFNYSHRLRHLAVQYRTRRRHLIRLAQLYAARRFSLLEGR